MNNVQTFFKNFWNDEEGLETIEMLLILSVLIAIAIMFKGKIEEWVKSLFTDIDNEIL
ncbi:MULTISPECIES: Flp1 family type IVb pilin [Gracilibacillus]|uniref:Flp1 family type IVb pilin n=1 Tax=Gracilibacillus TaxID=74385 RepID=UPI00098FCFE3|nr:MULTISPECIES: Flp1 family type IVb pilin [Gracilibacillus]